MDATKLLLQLVTNPVTSPKAESVEARNCISSLIGATKMSASSAYKEARMGLPWSRWRLPLLGNVVISKKFLRTRKIMVMHSNERGECRLRTLVDRNGCVDTT